MYVDFTEKIFLIVKLKMGREFIHNCLKIMRNKRELFNIMDHFEFLLILLINIWIFVTSNG